MFTPRGGLKAVTKRTEGGSNIDLGARSGWGKDHFTTTGMRDNAPVSKSRLYVKKTAAPNKNADSEPGLWGSAQDFPPRQTFTTTRELMDAPDKSNSRMRDSSRAAKSEMRLGYPEAEAKHPWRTSAMNQFKDPLLGKRKEGPTALPQPVYPAPADWSHPITGVRAATQKTNLFERFSRDERKNRISNDQLYKSQFNPQNSTVNIITGYGSIGQTFGKTAPQKQALKRPTLGSLGAIRP